MGAGGEEAAGRCLTLNWADCLASPVSCHGHSWVDLALLLSFLQVNCVTFRNFRLEKESNNALLVRA